MKVIKYFGGKGGVFVKKILSMLPKRDIYIEPFGGSATILLSQKSNVEIYNDIYDNVYNLMKVLQDERLFEQFCRKLELSYYCEKMRGEAKEILKAKDVDAVMKAWAYFYYNRSSYNGDGAFFLNTSVRRRLSKSVSDFLSVVDGLPEFHQRMSNVLVLNKDALGLIEKFDSENVFFYLDPPYHHSTRGATRYECDMSDSQHTELVDICLKSKAKILLSGYECEEYKKLEDAGWNKELFEVKTVTSNNERKTKTEVFWWNYKLENNLF